MDNQWKKQVNDLISETVIPALEEDFAYTNLLDKIEVLNYFLERIATLRHSSQPPGFLYLHLGE